VLWTGRGGLFLGCGQEILLSEFDVHVSVHLGNVGGLIEKFKDCFYFSFPVLDVATLY
jgi:hypothetical protein